jgi:hypothetical protein
MITFVNVAPTLMQWVALLLALVGLAWFVPRTVGDVILKRRGVETTGKVVGIRRDNSNQGNASAATIEFIDARNRPYTFKSDLPVTDDTGFVGASVAVIYDPKNPARAREANRPLANLLVTVLVYGLIVAALLCVFIPSLAAIL